MYYQVLRLTLTPNSTMIKSYVTAILFFFNHPTTTDIYTLSLHDALPIFNHHATIDAIRSLDRPLLLLNGLVLMTVAVIPFPTGLVARYLEVGHDQALAAFAYGLTMSGMALAFTLMNSYAKARHLFTTPFSLLGFSTGMLAYPLGTVIALFNYQLALAIYAATAVFYMVLPLLRERRMRQSR